MSTTSRPFLTGLFHDRADAESAVEQLHDLGYTHDEISVMMSDQTRSRDFAEATGSKAAEGATTGGIVGGAIGAILAGVTATGAILAVAGTGGLAAPIVVGPLAAVLAGLGAGGLAGGIIGALVGAGIPEERARVIESGLKEGGILVAVQPHMGDEERVARILHSDDLEPARRPTETGEIESRDYFASDADITTPEISR
jgi:hypothetical protein